MSDEPSNETRDETEPELSQLQQDFDSGPAPVAMVTVPVRLDGPALTHALPARVADSRYLNSSTTLTMELAGMDLRRSYLRIIATTATYVGHDRRLVDAGEVGQIPAGVMLELPTATPVFVRAVAAAGVVSYWSGQWAD